MSRHVRAFGYIENESLAAMYNLAEAFVFPSLYEGFGIPTLEAMACGAPVVTSNTTSFPEVVGSAGVLVDPLEPEAIADGIARVVRDPSSGCTCRDLADSALGSSVGHGRRSKL